MKVLSIEDIMYIHKMCLQLQGSKLIGTRDMNRLHSIINQQNQIVFGKELYPSIYDKAAMLWESLSLSHIFIDGNKRAAFLSTVLLLELNNISMVIEEIESTYHFAISIITNHLNTDHIKEYLISNTKEQVISTDNSHKGVLKEILKNDKILEILHLLSQ